MINQIQKFIYFLKRGGLNCALSVSMQRGKYKESADIVGEKFYDYFTKLPVSQYEKELIRQLKLFVPGGTTYNISNPRTFNEKIQWLKIHDHSELKTRLADKYAVREWVSQKIGDQFLIPLVGGPWEKGEDIEFTALPNQFVLKANHASQRNIVVKDKTSLNIELTIRSANQWMNTLYGWRGMETHYFNIPRRIIAEKYIEQIDGELLDYKLYCFNGEPVFILMIGDRKPDSHDGRLAIYNTNWELQDFSTGDYPEFEYKLEKPGNLNELIEIARILAEGFLFVRVDLYNIEGRIYFGEMTFTPGNGFFPWKPNHANLHVGELLNLP